MTRSKQTARKAKAKTPEPTKLKPAALRDAPKSAPPAKRKKLREELDEELSDDDFELLLGKVKDTEKQKRLQGILTPVKKGSDGESDEDEDDEDFEMMEDDSEDEEGDDDEEDDDDEDDDDDDDDDDEEDDDEDDDDEEEDDDDEDEEENASPKVTQKAKQAQNGAKKTATVKKGKENAKAKSAPELQEDDSIKSTNLAGKTPELLLFVKNLPAKVTHSQIQELCPSVETIQLNLKKKFAFLKFASEKATAAAHKLLKGKSINKSALLVDFVGVKSQNKPTLAKKEPASKDLCKLYVGGFGRHMDLASLKKLFPDGSEYNLPLKKKNKNCPCGFAFVHFTNEGACKKAHDAAQGKTHIGHKLSVLYAEKRSGQVAGDKRKATPSKAKKEAPAAKKAKATPKKPAVVEEEEEDEEDEDEDDDEDVDDDEDNDDEDDE